MLATHLNEIENPPFQIGQKVRIREDGRGGEIFRVVGATYEYRSVAARGWNFWLATENDIEHGYGGTDGFGPADLALAEEG